ncbi:hypothetical protein ABZP36_012518 [Zizania latifolia]
MLTLTWKGIGVARGLVQASAGLAVSGGPIRGPSVSGPLFSWEPTRDRWRRAQQGAWRAGGSAVDRLAEAVRVVGRDVDTGVAGAGADILELAMAKGSMFSWLSYSKEGHP